MSIRDEKNPCPVRVRSGERRRESEAGYRIDADCGGHGWTWTNTDHWPVTDERGANTDHRPVADARGATRISGPKKRPREEKRRKKIRCNSVLIRDEGESVSCPCSSGERRRGSEAGHGSTPIAGGHGWTWTNTDHWPVTDERGANTDCRPVADARGATRISGPKKRPREEKRRKKNPCNSVSIRDEENPCPVRVRVARPSRIGGWSRIDADCGRSRMKRGPTRITGRSRMNAEQHG